MKVEADDDDEPVEEEEQKDRPLTEEEMKEQLKRTIVK